MTETTHTPLPAIWIIPGAIKPGVIYAMAWKEGEFSKPLYAEDVPALLARVAELEAQNALFREALKPFVAVNLAYTYNIDDSAFVWWHHEDGEITLGDLRRARAALPTTNLCTESTAQGDAS